jgi:hypothetical protein
VTGDFFPFSFSHGLFFHHNQGGTGGGVLDGRECISFVDTTERLYQSNKNQLSNKSFFAQNSHFENGEGKKQPSSRSGDTWVKVCTI